MLRIPDEYYLLEVMRVAERYLTHLYVNTCKLVTEACTGKLQSACRKQHR